MQKQWNLTYMSKYVCIEEVRKNPYFPWCREGLSCNRGITIEDVFNLDLPNATGNWVSRSLSRCIDIREVRANPHCKWDRAGLSCNRDITVSDIQNLYLPCATGHWMWDDISRYIPIREVIENPSLPWTTSLSCNRGITVKVLELIDQGRYEHLQRDYLPIMYSGFTDIICLTHQ